MRKTTRVKESDRQLQLDFAAQKRPEPRAQPAFGARPALRVIQGQGERARERLSSRDAVIRVLLETGADLLLRKISPVRAEAIEKEVEDVLALFDRVDDVPALMPVLKRRLDELELLMRETREKRPTRRSL